MGSGKGGGSSGEFPSEMDWIFEEMLGQPFTRFRPAASWRPAVNLYETTDYFVVCVDLAGMEQKDFDVAVHRNALIVRGKRHRPACDKQTSEFRVHVMEINTGEFSRSVEIPSSVQQDKIEAEYTDGLLRIKLPKSR